MTLTHDSDSPRPLRRSELDLASQQLRAIESFTAAQRMAEDAAAVTARSRELRMDSSRALEVLRREHDALVVRAHEQLRLSADLLHRGRGRRVILAHRNEWFLGKLTDLLEAGGWEVVARLGNGADAVGAAVAEQPELLLVEDTLAMVLGEQVVREVRQYCPGTLITAQVADSQRIGVLLDAGACEVFTRRVPPAEVAARLLALAVA